MSGAPQPAASALPPAPEALLAASASADPEPAADAGPGARMDATATVRLECYAWLCRELGLSRAESATRDLALPADGTVRALLRALAADSEPFRRLVYDVHDDRLREYVALIVNGRAVELAGGLDARLAPGDHLLLLPGFAGG